MAHGKKRESEREEEQPRPGAPPARVPGGDTATNAEGIKKYEALFQLARDILSRELDRGKRKEEIAARYFTVFGFLLGVTTTLGGPVIREVVPPRDCLQGISLIFGLLFVILMLAGLGCTLAAMQSSPLREPGLTDNLLDRVQTDTYVDFLYSLTLSFRQAQDHNAPLIDQRADNVNRAHTSVILALGALVLCAVFSAARAWPKHP